MFKVVNQLAAAVVPLPIGSYCDTNIDLTMSGSTVTSNRTYSCCMDFQGAQWKTTGLGKSTGLYTKGVYYSIDPVTKVCTSKAEPSQGPPDAIPFSFLIIDDDSRGTATKVGTAVIDGVTCDHWQHERGTTGVMNWYLADVKGSTGQRLVRTDFLQGGTNASGTRDFNKAWVTPFPADSFKVPANCPKPTTIATGAGAAPMLPSWASRAYGDAVTYKIAATPTSKTAATTGEPDVCSPCYEKPPACTGSETSVQITGVTGDFCSPLCYQNQCPKGDGSFTATPSCVLETQGSSKPTQCALICTPGDDAACPAGASCQSIQGEGICTYPSRR